MGINFGGVLVWSLVVLMVEVMVEEVVVAEVIVIGGAMPMKTTSSKSKK